MGGGERALQGERVLAERTGMGEEGGKEGVSQGSQPSSGLIKIKAGPTIHICQPLMEREPSLCSASE